MRLKKLFQVLVMGGAAIGATHCGPGPDSAGNSQSTNTGLSNKGGGANDGGTAPTDSGSGGGSPHPW